jgi:uncharacterized damage-inducible protein DinB
MDDQPAHDAPAEPLPTLADPKELLLAYLDYYRDAVVRKVDGLTDDQLRASIVPSGWTPAELVKHLLYMERRWLRWGFLAEDVPDPHGDKDARGRWHVDPAEPIGALTAELLAAGDRTRAIVTGADLDQVAAVGGRFPADAPEPPPTLAWILFHVLQEYARHAGHLDVVRELADGATGE